MGVQLHLCCYTLVGIDPVPSLVVARKSEEEPGGSGRGEGMQYGVGYCLHEGMP